MSEIPDEFKVALSFEAEQREFAKNVAEVLESRLGKGTVFYDYWYQDHVAGPGGVKRLYEVYRERSRLIVQFITEKYESRPWTAAENEQIQAQARIWQTSRDESDHFRVFPLLAEAEDVTGHAQILANIWEKNAGETADMIMSRLAKVGEKRKVYLALCAPELEQRRNNVKAYLEDRGWEILPKSSKGDEAYDTQIRRDMKVAVAFVQLLDAIPRSGSLSDAAQYQCAIDAGKCTVRWRSESVETKKVSEADPKHAEFIAASDILVRDFADFKNHLGKQLDTTWQKKRVEQVPPVDAQAALTYVAICSKNPDTLWEKAFDRIIGQGVGCYKLNRDETFLARHQAIPCNGFIVMCDDAAYGEDGQLSSQQCLDHCLQIQLKEKDSRRRPPVGVMYWPPPSPLWSKLLGCIPLKLHQMLGDHLDKLDQFFEEVKGTAK